jgi:Uma2 family endonuclease
MTAARALHEMTFEEYLAFEEASDEKHEWINGYIFAMAGGTPRHAQLSANAIGLLRGILGPSGCSVFSSDLRVTIRETTRRTYPDVTVICGPLEQDPADRNAITNPTLIVEVLSDSTEASDRGEKWRHYRTLPSLQSYVLINTREPLVEVFTRSGTSWSLRDAGPGDFAALGLHDARLDVDALYAGVVDDA